MSREPEACVRPTPEPAPHSGVSEEGISTSDFSFSTSNFIPVAIAFAVRQSGVNADGRLLGLRLHCS